MASGPRDLFLLSSPAEVPLHWEELSRLHHEPDGLPGEHGFRFFPGFYKHITDTMKRIPFRKQGSSCYDNLVMATRILLARAGKAENLWAARFPKTLDDLKVAFRELFTNLGIPPEEVEVFVKQMLGLATIFPSLCMRRRCWIRSGSGWDCRI